jgi:hypothetical protein
VNSFGTATNPGDSSRVEEWLLSLRFHSPLIGRVEDWRAHGRVRWLVQAFRLGPQSGSHGHVSSPRLVKLSRRISRTPLS